MNTRAKSILMAVALAAAASVQISQAADQSAWFKQQREMTDGNPTSHFVPTPERTEPATPHQIAESRWFDAERTREGRVLPFPFPLPDAAPVVATKSRPTTVSQAPQDKSWKRERSADEGYDSPSQFQN
jgi:hypothetical protein